MKRLFLLLAALIMLSAVQTKANDIDTVWFRWIYNVSDVCWSPKDSIIYAFSHSENKAMKIDPFNGNIDTSINWGYPTYQKISLDGNFINFYTSNPTPYVMDTKSLTPILNFESPGDYSRDYSISPTNKVVGISSDMTTLRVWDIATGKITLTKKIGMLDEVNWIRTKLFSAQYTADGKYLIVSADSIQRINAQTGETILLDAYTLVLDANSLETVKKIRDVYGSSRQNFVSKTGKYFAAETDMTNILRIIDIETEEVVFVINLSTANYGFDFSSDDKYIAYTENGADIKGIQIWDLSNKTKVYEYRRNDNGPYTCVSFSNDNRYITACSAARFYLYRTDHFLSAEEDNNIQATITYPNPSHSSITVNFTLTNAGNTETSVIDLYGNTVKMVAKEMLNSGQHDYTVDMSSINNGTYFFKIVSGNSISVHKFILSK